MTEAFITLPWPPSVNGMYANAPGKGRIKSKRYRAWETEAGWELRRQHPPKFTTPVHMMIVFGQKSGRWDMSNFVKPIEDFLVSHDIIPDDNSRWIKKTTLTQEPDQEGVLVHLYPVAELAQVLTAEENAA